MVEFDNPQEAIQVRMGQLYCHYFGCSPLVTLVSGMALKLYASTPDQDAYQRAGFGIVLVFVSVVCVLLGVCSIIASTPCLRDTVMRRLKGVVKSGGKNKIMPMKKEVEMVES